MYLRALDHLHATEIVLHLEQPVCLSTLEGTSKLTTAPPCPPSSDLKTSRTLPIHNPVLNLT